MPKISIVLPTYNVEKYISRALNSCINQTLSDIEIIVVDDCGNDKSIEIAKEFASRDGRIKIIKNPQNLKLLHARANGVKHSSADYIMFLDPDDELEPNACEVAYRALENDIKVVRFDCKYVGFDNNYKLKFPKNYDDFVTKTQELYYFDFLMVNMLIHKDLYLKCLKYIEEYELYDINNYEDVAFNFVSNNLIKNFKTIDNKLYIYCKNDTSMMHDKTRLCIQTKALGIVIDFINFLATKYPEKFYNDLYLTHFIFLNNYYFELKRLLIREKYKSIKLFFIYKIKKISLKLEKNKFNKRKKELLEIRNKNA